MSTNEQRATITAPGDQSPRFHRGALIALGSLLVLALLSNVALFLWNRQLDQPLLTPLDGMSSQITTVVPVDEQRVVAATVDDRLLLLVNGQVTLEKQFDGVIGGVAVAPTHDAVYVGTGDGKVTELDLVFQILNEAAVAGRVVGIKTTASGGVFVAHGVATRTDRFYLSYFPQLGDEAAFRQRAEFTVYGLDVADETAYYGTGNSRVVVLGADGKPGWTSVIAFPVDRLLAVTALNQVLVSDERGNLVLLDKNGNQLWQVQPTGFRLKALSFDPTTDVYLAGDERGTVVGLDQTGKLLSSAKIGDSPIAGFISAQENQIIVVPSEGEWFALNTGALSGVGQASQLRIGWLIADVALLLVLGALLMRTVTAWWAMLGSLAHRMRRAYLFYLFVMPSLTLIVIFTYYPAVLAFNNSLTNMSLRRVTEYVGLENYVKILTSDFYFRVGFVNLLIIIVASILKTITVPLLVAELIFWLRSNTLKYLFRTFFIFPAVVPGLITILLWRMIYAPNIGLINQILRAVGLTQFETAWLGDERTALLAIVGAGFPFVNIFALLIYLGGLIDINPELFDASAIDGAGRWARFWRIDVPLLGQQFRLLLFFTFSGAIQGFASIWVFTRGGPGYATYTPALQMYRQLIDTEYGYGSAIGVLLFLMSFGVTLMLLRFRRATFV